MALVKCPECDREKVSDSAESCPNCGYGIKEHFQKIVYEKEQKCQEDEIIAEMPNITKPVPWEVIIGVFFAILSIGMFYIGFIMIGLFDGFLSFILIVGGGSTYSDKKRIYEMSLKNMEQAKSEELARQHLEKMMSDEIYSKLNPFKKVTNRVKCPMCGANSGKKITTTSRAVSIAMVGMASGKIGKQYKCTSCGYRW